ncbi:DUF485 domain-containing protein, partial [Streptomyces sp. TRM76130]|nr:DUF485 domain-containing protein [Streptomyces sp. TRM76130]
MSHAPHTPHPAPPPHAARPRRPAGPPPGPVPKDTGTLSLPAVRARGDVRTLRTAYRRQRRVATCAALGYFLV